MSKCVCILMTLANQIKVQHPHMSECTWVHTDITMVYNLGVWPTYCINYRLVVAAHLEALRAKYTFLDMFRNGIRYVCGTPTTRNQLYFRSWYLGARITVTLACLSLTVHWEQIFKQTELKFRDDINTLPPLSMCEFINSPLRAHSYYGYQGYIGLWWIMALCTE